MAMETGQGPRHKRGISRFVTPDALNEREISEKLVRAKGLA